MPESTVSGSRPPCELPNTEYVESYLTSPTSAAQGVTVAPVGRFDRYDYASTLTAIRHRNESIDASARSAFEASLSRCEMKVFEQEVTRLGLAVNSALSDEQKGSEVSKLWSGLIELSVAADLCRRSKLSHDKWCLEYFKAQVSASSNPEVSEAIEKAGEPHQEASYELRSGAWPHYRRGLKEFTDAASQLFPGTVFTFELDPTSHGNTRFPDNVANKEWPAKPSFSQPS